MLKHNSLKIRELLCIYVMPHQNVPMNIKKPIARCWVLVDVGCC